MKKIFILLIFIFAPAYAAVTENFEGIDENALKAGISKYILSRGGKINRGNSYSSNTFQGYEQFSKYSYIYKFDITPNENGAKLVLNVYKTSIDGTGELDSTSEKAIMDAISVSIKGRFLYGLGFDFEYYDYNGSKIKAPRGRETGIKLTAVKYDAAKKGLLIGDIITEINGTPLNQIPLNEYAAILHAKTLNDTLTLTYRRGNSTGTVVLTPRLSSVRTF